MKYRAIITTVITLILSDAAVSSSVHERGGPAELFATGVENYRNEDYREALVNWMELYDAGYDNHDLLYNIGNAWFQMDNIAMAILFYERALLRRPFSDEARENLEIAGSHIRVRFTEVPPPFFRRWTDTSALILSSDNWALISLALFLLALTSAMVALFLKKRGWRMVLFPAALFMIAASSITLLLSRHNRNLVYNSRYAVVTETLVTGRSSPSETGRELFILHEGIKVKREETLGEWTEIILPDGNRGWVPRDSMESL